MLKPRNSLVIVKLLETGSKTVGNIIVRTDGELYGYAEVMAVGPGTVMSAGGQPETFDLKVGQRVFMKTKEQKRDPNAIGGVRTVVSGMEFQADGVIYHIYEQGNVFVITEDAPAST